MNRITQPATLAFAVLMAFGTQAVFAHVESSEKAPASTGQPGPFGQPGTSKSVTDTIAINLTDAMRFSPDTVAIHHGNTVRFRITNIGKLPHEFVLGTQAEIKEHAEMMRRMPGMVHTDASSVRVAPGKTADIIWKFSRSGKFFYACLLPGHWEAGMQGTVIVSDPVKR